MKRIVRAIKTAPRLELAVCIACLIGIVVAGLRIAGLLGLRP